MSVMVFFLVIAGAHASTKVELVLNVEGVQSPPYKHFFPVVMKPKIECIVRGFSPQNLPLEMSVVHVSGDNTRETAQLHGAISVRDESAANGPKSYSATQTFTGITFKMCSDSLICKEKKSLNLTRNIEIHTNPPAPELFGNGNVSERESATLTCKAECTNGVTYTWFINGVFESKSESAVKVIPRVSMADNGDVYSCKVTRNFVTSPVSSNNVTFIVKLEAPTVETNAKGILGRRVVFTCCYPRNASNVAFVWYRNGLGIAGSRRYTTHVLQASDDGQLYSCKVTVGTQESGISKPPFKLRVKEYFLSLMLDKTTTAPQGTLPVEPGIHVLLCSIGGIPRVVTTLGVKASLGRVALNNCPTSTSVPGTVHLQRKTMNCTINVTRAQPVVEVGCELDPPQLSSNETYFVDLIVKGAVCGVGQYGDFCNGTCGHCANNKTCDRTTGNCRGCEPGWLPPTCLQPCRAGTFGPMCSKMCGHCSRNEICNHVTGFCLKCEAGWNGTTCHNGEKATFTGKLQTPVVHGKRQLIVGDSANLICSSLNTRAATYQWYADGSLISSITSMHYSIYPVTLKDNGREVACTVTVDGVTSDPSTDTVTLDVKSMRIWLMADDVASQVNQILDVEEGNHTMTCLADGAHSEVIGMDMAVMLDNLTLAGCVRTPGGLNNLPCNITRISVRWDCPVQLNRTGHTRDAQCVDLGFTVSPEHAEISVFAYRPDSRLQCPPDWQAGQSITLSCVLRFLKTTDPNVDKSCLQPRSDVELFFWQKAMSTNDNSTAYAPQCSVDTSRCNFTSMSWGCGCTVRGGDGSSVSMYTFVTDSSFNGWWRCGVSMSCLASDSNFTDHSGVNCDEKIAYAQVKETVDNYTLLWIFLGLFGVIGFLSTVSLCCNYHHHKDTCPGCCFAYQVDKPDTETQGWDGYALSIKRRWKRRDSPPKHAVFARSIFYYLGCLLPISGAMFIASGGELCSQHWAPCERDDGSPRGADKPKEWIPRPLPPPWKRYATESPSQTSTHSQSSGHAHRSEQVRFALDEEKSGQEQQKDVDQAGAEQAADKAGQHANDPDSEGGEERLNGVDKDTERKEGDSDNEQGDEQNFFA